MILQLKRRGKEEKITINLYDVPHNDIYDIPAGKELVYSDNEYKFILPKSAGKPSEVSVNDDTYEVDELKPSGENISFSIGKDGKPFSTCFGAIKIGIIINGRSYKSGSIAVMVSDTGISNDVINMVDYIYDNCERYLYEDSEASDSGNSRNTADSKFRLLDDIKRVYEQGYRFLKSNHYSKIVKTEKICSFDRLKSVSSATVIYISQHPEELIPVSYNTGIRFNRQFYQPENTLVESDSFSADVYENRIILGFLCSVMNDLNRMISGVKAVICNGASAVVQDGYFDSMHRIFSRNINNKLNLYCQKLSEYLSSFQRIYFNYSRLFGIKGTVVYAVPRFTPVFRSVMVYRQIYKVISDWFSGENYHFGKNELLLSFISTSKIYEYYCLIKLLHYISDSCEYKLELSKNYQYTINNDYYVNTKYNNTFLFSKAGKELSVFFQPVIFGNNSGENSIGLYRNTSSNSQTNCSELKGYTYTPDYIIKFKSGQNARYFILDAKFSTPANIRDYQLQTLVYKYLFSISPFSDDDTLEGLYIICGKNFSGDGTDSVHDIARKLSKKVRPFAEIVIMGGKNTDNDTIPKLIIDSIID